MMDLAHDADADVDEDLQLALELSLLVDLTPPTATSAPHAGARGTHHQIFGNVEIAQNAQIEDQPASAEEERLVRLAQLESEREHQAFLEQRALERAMQRSSSGRLTTSSPASMMTTSAPTSTAASSTVEDWTTDDVCAWLESEGLGMHVEAFRIEVVDGPTLLEVGEAELANSLGVTALGHRRRILRFIAAERVTSSQAPQRRFHPRGRGRQQHQRQQRQQQGRGQSPQHQPKHQQPQGRGQSPQYQPKHQQHQQRQQRGRGQSPQRQPLHHQQQQQQKNERHPLRWEEREQKRREKERRDEQLARALQEEEDQWTAQELSEAQDDVVSLAPALAPAPVPAPAPPAIVPTLTAPPVQSIWPGLLGLLQTPMAGIVPLVNHPIAHHPPTQTAPDDLLYEDLVNLSDVAVGVRDIDQLPTMVFRQGMLASDPSCVICMGDYAPGEVLRRVECLHVFHKACIDKWLHQSRKCPICNREMNF